MKKKFYKFGYTVPDYENISSLCTSIRLPENRFAKKKVTFPLIAVEEDGVKRELITGMPVEEYFLVKGWMKTKDLDFLKEKLEGYYLAEYLHETSQEDVITKLKKLKEDKDYTSTLEQEYVRKLEQLRADSQRIFLRDLEDAKKNDIANPDSIIREFIIKRNKYNN